MICPECDCRNDNKIFCVSCGIVFDSYFQRQKQIQEKAFLASQKAIKTKRLGFIFGSVLLLCGSLAVTYLSVNSNHGSEIASKETSKNVNVAEKQSRYEEIKKSKESYKQSSLAVIGIGEKKSISKKSRKDITPVFYNDKCLKGNCIDGFGVYDIPSYGKYSGYWKDGKRHGEGTFVGVNNSTYVGEWRNDKSHGHGSLTDADGNTYVGEWVDGLRHGKGICSFSDGSKYEGEFNNGIIEGQGILSDVKGNTVVGQFENGKPTDQCEKKIADRS